MNEQERETQEEETEREETIQDLDASGDESEDVKGGQAKTAVIDFKEIDAQG